MAVSFSLQSLLQQVSSVRGAVFIIGKICLVLAVGLAHAIGDNLRRSELRELPSSTIDIDGEASQDQTPKSIGSYQVIASRNIFGEEPKKDEPKEEPKQPKTSLKLRLVGTNVSSSGAPFAIIENTAKKEQDVFGLNEQIFEQAKLVAVLTESVKIEHGGKVELLEMEEGTGESSPDGGISSNEEGTEFSVAESELENALANLPRLLSQARAVPYFRNGQSIGMRLFAIRRGSLYEKLGLKNGDIILSVNDNSVNDPAQALKIFEQLKNERSINLELERNGQSSQLQYTIR